MYGDDVRRGAGEPAQTPYASFSTVTRAALTVRTRYTIIAVPAHGKGQHTLYVTSTLIIQTTLIFVNKLV